MKEVLKNYQIVHFPNITLFSIIHHNVNGLLFLHLIYLLLYCSWYSNRPSNYCESSLLLLKEIAKIKEKRKNDKERQSKLILIKNRTIKKSSKELIPKKWSKEYYQRLEKVKILYFGAPTLFSLPVDIKTKGPSISCEMNCYLLWHIN